MQFIPIISYIILALYVVPLCYITIYCLLQFHLLVKYRSKPKTKKETPILNGKRPFVTVQLPIYNEQYVVNRLIDNITKLHYPKERFEIHILDDSTDETVQLVEAKVKEYENKGFAIKHIRRTNRTGYKAGALKDAMQYAKGEFIAIFDADFLPKTSFLLDTMAHFQNPDVGVVQTRWEHLNQDYSILTELQAFQLNVHFTIEQKGRMAGNYLLQFNGTAGVWRRESIDSAGGWEADTLTEDLDLSYRAQLKGWEIVYLEDILSPAELPVEINGLKSQQFRWMKGGAETAKKMLPTIWKSNLALNKKLHASVHLLGSSVFLCVFCIGVFSVPLAFLIGGLNIQMNYFAVFLISLLAITQVYYVANVGKAWPQESKIKMIAKFIFLFPIFLSLSMGLSFHNSIAVIQGLVGKKSAFIRTPKFNIKTITDKLSTQSYIQRKISKTTIFEGFLAIYFIVGLIGSIYAQTYYFVLFHALLAIGYSTIFILSIRQLSIKS